VGLVEGVRRVAGDAAAARLGAPLAGQAGTAPAALPEQAKRSA
jgi:hypothetical protein